MTDRRESKLEASIGLSRKWDAREAGREVAKSAIKNLIQPPSFFLLFSTIHYKDHGGFQEFLNGVWDVLPEGTPLIGGTIAAFINNYGCYSRGATALAVSYPNMDVAVGIGKHTKRKPKNAARQCANMILDRLKNSNYKNKFLIDVISGPETPNLPIVGRINYINNRFLGWIASYIGMKLFSILGGGPGKEEDIIQQLSLYMPNYNIFGGSSVDKGEIFKNYQFIDNEFHTNSVVAIGCSIDLSIFLDGVIGLHPTNKKFEITDTTAHGRVITKINNQPARAEIVKLLDYPEEKLEQIEHFYYTTSDYFPITFEENADRVIGMGPFLGNSIVMGHRVGGKHANFLSITGEEITNNINKIFQNFNQDSFPFIFSYSSSIYPFMLGRKTFDIKTLLDIKIGKTPYLMVCPMVENIRIIGNEPSIRVYSTNIFSLGKFSKVGRDNNYK